MDLSFLWNRDTKADEAFIQQFIQLLDEGKNEEAYWAFFARFAEKICKKIIAKDLNSEYRYQIPKIFEDGLKEIIEKYSQRKSEIRDPIRNYLSYIEKAIRNNYIDYIRKQKSIEKKSEREAKKEHKKEQVFSREMIADIWILALEDLKPVCKELIKKVKAVIKTDNNNKIKLKPYNGELKAITFAIISLKPKEIRESGLVKTFDQYQKHNIDNSSRIESDVAYDWIRQTFNRCGENFISEFVRILEERRK